jgi:transposase InsO family protein
LTGWVEFDLRDQIVAFIEKWQQRAKVSYGKLCHFVGITPQRFCDWKKRKGQPNRHGNEIPHRNWLTEEECRLIVAFYLEHEEDGYRRCAYMMMDSDIIYAQPSTVYKVLCRHDVIRHWKRKKSLKGTGFVQPLAVHEHWHMDITYVHISKKHYYLITIIDGCSRFIVAWDLREKMEDSDVGIVQQNALERFPEASGRFITDNGSQFIGKEFKEFIAQHGFSHVKTSPYYPQSNGKIERWHKSIKGECIRRKHFADVDYAREVIAAYVDYYNEIRLHSAIGYVTPRIRLEGRQDAVHAERERKLDLARKKRAVRLETSKSHCKVKTSDEAEASSAGAHLAKE